MITRGRIRRIVSDLLKYDIVFLDTETTGLGCEAELCEICILDKNGDILMDTLVHPTSPIPQHVSEKNGITNDMLIDTSKLINIWEDICIILSGKVIVAYNAQFDLRILFQSAVYGLPTVGIGQLTVDFLMVVDAMQLFAAYYSDAVSHLYRWKSLKSAAEFFDIPNPGAHRAQNDAEVLRQVFLKMGEDIPE